MFAQGQYLSKLDVLVTSAFPLNLLQNYFAPLREEQFLKSSLEQGERRNQEAALLDLAYTLASLGRLAHELASSQKLRQLSDVRRDQPRFVLCHKLFTGTALSA
jgi:hypothetical protein